MIEMQYSLEKRRTVMKSKINWKEYGTLTVGMFFVSVAVYYLMLPNKFVVGSTSGLVMVLANFIPLKISTMSFIVNAILLVIGYIVIGKEFGVKTIITSFMLPVYLRIFEIVTPDVPQLTNESLLNVLCYVLVISFGQAMLFNANASSGGLDIVAKIINKYTHMEIGKALTVAGFVTASTSILVYDRKTLVVSLIGTYIGGVILDNFIDGFNIRKRVCIMSRDHHAEIQKYIVYDLNRGATLYPAIGGMENREQLEVVTVLEKFEYAKLMSYLNEIDPKAFVTVSTVNAVVGNWNENKKNRLRGKE